MRKLTAALFAALVAAGPGCGGSTKMSTAPLTDEQKAQIKADDARISDEESGGRGDKLGGKPKGKKN